MGTRIIGILAALSIGAAMTSPAYAQIRELPAAAAPRTFDYLMEVMRLHHNTCTLQYALRAEDCDADFIRPMLMAAMLNIRVNFLRNPWGEIGKLCKQLDDVTGPNGLWPNPAYPTTNIGELCTGARN